MSLLDWASGIAGTAADVMNYVNQVQAMKWQREAQQTTWAREDNAVQRRVADLKAAGLNPVLAAGSSATSSSPISPTVPHMQVTGLDKVAASQQLRQNQLTQNLISQQAKKAGWEASIAEREDKYIESMKNLELAERYNRMQVDQRQMELTAEQMQKLRAEIAGINLNNATALYNFDIAQRRGTTYGGSGKTADFLNAGDAIGKVLTGIPGFGDLINKVMNGGKK